MKMTDLMSPHVVDAGEAASLGALLLDHGVDLASTPSPTVLERGTPVYVDANADPVVVQRRMAEAHVRMLFVIEAGRVVGAVDIADLTARSDGLPWPLQPATPGPAG